MIVPLPAPLPAQAPSEVPPAVSSASEVVIRPEGCLARGRYEAPSWVFLAVAMTALLALASTAGRAVWGLRKRQYDRAPRSRGGRAKA